jgi:hypothetical protein
LAYRVDRGNQSIRFPGKVYRCPHAGAQEEAVLIAAAINVKSHDFSAIVDSFAIG